ncbi:hypothetical protein PG997_001373 [Apiospora hydei]|uniref:Major facilitator superfamily (MFS) profile domain-containing protein n=1 Tax=Apiospora hydei TaxID=1337664 RepID=A0ABR1XDF0_9PEZI
MAVAVPPPRKRARLSGGALIGVITLVDAVSSCWFGYCQGVFAGVLVSEDFQRLFPQTNDAAISGIVTSCFLLGAFFGAIAAFILGDKLGRKRTIALGHSLNLVGAVLQFTSWHLPQLLVGRVVNGVGMGMTSTISPVYLAECARSHLRGRLLVVGASSNVSCFCLANWISYGMYFHDHGAGGAMQWRFPLAFQLVFAAVLALLAWVPESPRWLLLVDRDEEALRVIAQISGGSGGSGGSSSDESSGSDETEEGRNQPQQEDPLVVAEYRSIKTAIRLERESRVPLIDVLCHRDKTQNFRRLLLACGTQFMQQFSGINALDQVRADPCADRIYHSKGFYFPTLLHENVGFDEQMSRLLTAVSGTIYLVAAFCSLFVIDRIGRRKLMLNGAVGMAVCHLIAAICLKVGEDDPSKTKTMGNVTVAMFVLYHVFFSPTWGGVPWVYSAEINSLGWRSRGAAAATGTNWLMAFVVVQFTKAGVDNLRWAFYLIFAAFCICFAPIVFCFYPETSNRTLEDMDQIFIRNPSVLVCGNDEMTQRARPQALVDAETERISSSAAGDDTSGGGGEDSNSGPGPTTVVAVKAGPTK